MIVDVHTHLWERSEQWGEQTARHLSQKAAQVPLNVSGWAFDQAMKPVDVAIILGFQSARLQADIDAQQVAAYVKRQPDRYLGFVGIDPLAPGWQDRLKEAVDLGLVGVCFSPAGQACHPIHTQAMKLYEQCQKRKLPILIHPGTHLGAETVMAFAQPHLLDEVGQAFPELRLVLTQLGYPWIDQALVLLEKHPHFFADLSHLTAQPWLLYNSVLAAWQQGVADHLLLGSDFPFCLPQQAMINLYSVNQHVHGTGLPTVPRHVLRGIIERDTLECFGLSDKITPPARQLTGESDSETEDSDQDAA